MFKSIAFNFPEEFTSKIQNLTFRPENEDQISFTRKIPKEAKVLPCEVLLFKKSSPQIYTLDRDL